LTRTELRRASCRALSLARLAAGSYAAQEICEPAAALPLRWLIPQQNRPNVEAGLRLAPRVSVWIPEADCGGNLLGVYPKAESLVALLVPPRSAGLRGINFNPPMFGLRQIALAMRCDRSLQEYRRNVVEGPFVPVARVGRRPNFAAPLLCDWVPVRARMMPLPVEIAVRDSAVAFGPGEFVPMDGEPRVAGPVPVLRVPLAGGPVLKGDSQRLRKISLDGVIPHQDALQPKAMLEHEQIQTGKVLPAGRLRLAKDRPTMEIERRLTAPIWRRFLYRAGDAWNGSSAVTRLGGVMMAILLVVFVTMPRSQAGGTDLQASLTGGWDHVKQNILERAAVALTDDFRAGLADWEGEGDWARAWSYDQSGFVRTGPMALYTPSLQLTNYTMEFLGQIEKRSLGWVVRAADSRNYYAVKLTVADPGPVPEVIIQRYAVIDGKAQGVKQKRLPIEVRMDTLYRIQMEVRENDFTLSVQGQVVDSWSEPRLPKGGIGFFSGKGELARLRWVGVWHQYDTLGRLCALLAPQGIADRDRGVSQ
jgi:hypothetical protein